MARGGHRRLAGCINSWTGRSRAILACGAASTKVCYATNRPHSNRPREGGRDLPSPPSRERVTVGVQAIGRHRVARLLAPFKSVLPLRPIAQWTASQPDAVHRVEDGAANSVRTGTPRWRPETPVASQSVASGHNCRLLSKWSWTRPGGTGLRTPPARWRPAFPRSPEREY